LTAGRVGGRIRSRREEAQNCEDYATTAHPPNYGPGSKSTTELTGGKESVQKAARKKGRRGRKHWINSTFGGKKRKRKQKIRQKSKLRASSIFGGVMKREEKGKRNRI